MQPGLSTHDLFDGLLRRMAKASSQAPLLRPWIAEERVEILERGRRILGIEFIQPPRITTTAVGSVAGDGYSLECLQTTSWEGCRGAAHLYLPAGVTRKLPCVMLCCGHGKGGKLAAAYQAMARSLARSGMAVLVPDNLGQGERQPMGHRHVVKPFACGCSLQGLIVLETLGWLDWLCDHPRIDAGSLAAIGNSGGGLLTMWIGAFVGERLKAVGSSGYPGSITYIAQKEKEHCHCNILPGMVGSLEMWQLYGCIAPRPLYLCQGDADEYFPVETFLANARRTVHAYQLQGVGDRVRFDVVEGGHAWDARRVALTTQFLAPLLGTAAMVSDLTDPLLAEAAHCYATWPDDALTTDQLAEFVTGTKVPDSVELWDVYEVPEVSGETSFPLRGPARQIAAQFAAFTYAESADRPLEPHGGNEPKSLQQ